MSREIDYDGNVYCDNCGYVYHEGFDLPEICEHLNEQEKADIREEYKNVNICSKECAEEYHLDLCKHQGVETAAIGQDSQKTAEMATYDICTCCKIKSDRKIIKRMTEQQLIKLIKEGEGSE